MRDERRFIEWFGGLALSVWVGGLIAVTVAAFAVFRELHDDRALAGRVFGAVLADFRRVEIVCAAAVLLGAMFLLSRPATRRDLARLFLAAFMTASLAGYAVWVGPQLLALRPQITSFDLPADRDPSARRLAFDRLHRLYSGLAGANIALGIVLLSIWKRPTPAPAKTP